KRFGRRRPRARPSIRTVRASSARARRSKSSHATGSRSSRAISRPPSRSEATSPQRSRRSWRGRGKRRMRAKTLCEPPKRPGKPRPPPRRRLRPDARRSTPRSRDSRGSSPSSELLPGASRRSRRPRTPSRASAPSGAPSKARSVRRPRRPRSSASASPRPSGPRAPQGTDGPSSARLPNPRPATGPRSARRPTRPAFSATRWSRAWPTRTKVARATRSTPRREVVLLDRLAASPGGGECAGLLRAARSAGGTEASATGRFFDAWLTVRQWIQRRLPAPLGEMPEPLQALERLRGELESLEERLARQDADLRGTSEDVARGIDVQLRRAAHQVRRLNQHLDGIRFGSITGIRVQMRRIERMEQVLRALREGAAQELLFRPTMPIEDALDEIFRRYGGGRTGGSARVLDYREYAELA